MTKPIRLILLTLLVLLLLAAGGLVLWGLTPSAPLPEALTALQTGADVQVQTAPWLTFTPAISPETSLIIYPGVHVDARAYAPQARAIASQGYLVVIVPVPLSLAFFGLDRALSRAGAQGDINLFQFDIDQLSARANPLKLQVALLQLCSFIFLVSSVMVHSMEGMVSSTS